MLMISKSNENGFTLIEMLIAIAIFATLVAIAIPTFKTFLAQRRLNGAARELQTNLAALRMQAVAENKWMALYVNNSHQYTLFRDANKNGTIDSGETIVAKDFQPSYYDVTFSYGSGAVVTFYPNGTSSTGTFCVNGASGLNIKKITLNTNGRVNAVETTSCP